MIPVFDGHNDLLCRLWRDRDRRAALWRGDIVEGHLDLPRMRAGGMVGGLFAIWVPSPDALDADAFAAVTVAERYDIPLPRELTRAEALGPSLEMAATLHWLARTGDLTIATSVERIRAAMTQGRIAAVMHLEGAEALDTDLDQLHLWYGFGLRSIGPLWSRPNRFGHGVPARFPGSPDTGPGLTEAGVRLVRECDRLGLLVDLSHLTERGMDDVARVTEGPLVATHSNAHAICPCPRNLTDRQLDLIAERNGMVGLNFATSFLDPAGRTHAFEGWDPLLRHLDHLISRLGEDRVGLGSDFDGATIPLSIGDAAGLQHLAGALSAHGYNRPLLEKLFFRNWLAVLERTWRGEKGSATKFRH